MHRTENAFALNNLRRRTVVKKRLGLLVGLGCLLLAFSGCQTVPPPETASEEAPTEMSPPPEPIVEPSTEPETTAVIEEPIQLPELVRISGIARQAESLGAEASQVENSDVWLIKKADRVLKLTENSRKAELNGTVVFLNETFEKSNGSFALSDSDYEYLLKPSMNGVEGSLRSKVIVIDPGHGGSEVGTHSDTLNLSEKDLNIDVSLRLRTLLESMGYKVVLTRYDDRLVPLEDRSKIANRSNAGLFVSIHFNAALNTDAMGIETFVLTNPGAASTNQLEVDELGSQALLGNRYDELNFGLGLEIQSSLIHDLQRLDRGFKKARFKVLKDLDCPGVLVECGFLSHSKEALLVNTPVYRQKLAESLAKSIDRFSRRHAPNDS